MALLLLAGCGGGTTSPPIPEETVAVDVDGLSGLTVDGGGTLYGVAERDRAIVAFEDAGPRIIPVEGVPDVDLEAIAWLEGRRFAVASEDDDADRADDLLFVLEVDDVARVVETIHVPYAAIGAVPDENDGLEGLCVVGDTWIAALEHPHEGLATLAVRGPGGRWSGREMRLTTRIGKLSALTCEADGDGIRVFAIERGIERSLFGDEWVARVLRFSLPAPGRLALPEVVADLAGRVPDQPNPEGLAVVDDEAWILTDNHYRVRVGATRLLRAALSPVRPL